MLSGHRVPATTEILVRDGRIKVSDEAAISDVRSNATGSASMARSRQRSAAREVFTAQQAYCAPAVYAASPVSLARPMLP